MAEAAVATPSTPSAPPPAATPAPSSTKFDLDAFRENGKKEVPPAEAKANTPDDDADDPDFDADPELAKEADAIEKPKPEETKQERNRRRRKAKEAARKARQTRLQNERDAARTELDEWRSGKRTAQEAPAHGAPAARESEKAAPPEPTRAKPTLKDFPLEKFKDEDDPWAAQSAALAEAVTDWKWEQHQHAAKLESQASQSRAEVTALNKALDTSEDEARGRYADYDSVVDAARFDQTPASDYVRESIMRSGVFGPLRYHLCKHPDTMRAILASRTPREVDWALGAEIATVKAALKEAEKPAAPKVNAATEPVQPVTAGAGTGAVLRDPYKDAGSKVDIDELRAAKRAGRR